MMVDGKRSAHSCAFLLRPPRDKAHAALRPQPAGRRRCARDRICSDAV